MMLSRFVPAHLALRSETAQRYGIENLPANKEHELNMVHVCREIIDPVFDHFNLPMAYAGSVINSFYRSPELNNHPNIKGSSTSQHCLGEAVDLDFDPVEGLTNTQLFLWIAKNLNFHQIIWEYENPDGSPKWVHVGLKRVGNNARRLTKAVKKGGKTEYIALPPDFLNNLGQHDYKKEFSIRMGNHQSGYLDRFDKLLKATGGHEGA